MVEQTVIGVEHPLPHDDDRDRPRDDRQIEHAAEKGAHARMHTINDRANPQRESRDDRHRDDYDEPDDNTEEDVDYFLAEFPAIVERLRNMSPLYATRGLTQQRCDSASCKESECKIRGS